MVDWFYIGYCTVMAMFAVAAAYAAVVGLRALRRLSRSLLLGFAAAAIVATLTAQKTNNVPPNMNQPQMMQGGGSFQTGFTGLTGLVGIGNLISLVNSAQTTIDDIMRGWRVESVATNAAVSYAMPTNATLVGNWHIHGASLPFDFTVVEPLELEEVYVDRQNNGSPNVAGSFVAYIGIAVMPTNVSFDAVRVQEIGSMATNVYGYFSNMTNVFDHGQHGANIWHGLMANRYQDKVSISEVPEPWGQGGGFTWPITNAWRVAHDNAVTNHFSHRLKYDQTFELDSNGTVRIRKMGYTIQRTTNDVLTAIREMP